MTMILLRRLFLMGLSIGLIQCGLWAMGPIAEAETYYKNQDYAKAMAIYEQLREENLNNHTILYNMGNVYFRQQALGKAICYYLKAAKLDPRDHDIQAKLTLSRAQVVDAIKPSGSPFFLALQACLSKMTVNELWVGLILVFSLFNGLLFRLVRGRSDDLTKNAFALSVVLLLCVSLPTVLKSQEGESGVIIQSKAEVKSGPDATLSETLFLIHEGTEFVITKRLGQWADIRLKNGFSGWVQVGTFWDV